MACNPSSPACLSNNLASLMAPELEAKAVHREASPNKDCTATKLHKMSNPPLPAIRAGRIHRLLTTLPPPQELHQPPAFPRACQALSPTQILPSTTEHSTPLPRNTNSMPWVDTNNKELATTTDTPDTRSSSGAPSRVVSDTHK